MINIKSKEGKEAFITHYNYCNCLECLTDGITIIFLNKLNKIKLKHIDRKKNLIELTKKSLEDEYKIVYQDPEYSYASTSWLPIKTYYLIYNLLLTIEYLIQTDESIYNYGHRKCVKEFTRKLEFKEIKFSQPLLNEVYRREIFDHKEISGANLSKRIGIDRMFKLAMKKIANYKWDEWKRKENLDFRTKAGKARKEKFLNSFRVSIFEFPYYMRIRSNYRDFAFIDGVTIEDTKNYFNSYYRFSRNLVVALEGLLDDMLSTRGCDPFNITISVSKENIF